MAEINQGDRFAHLAIGRVVEVIDDPGGVGASGPSASWVKVIEWSVEPTRVGQRLLMNHDMLRDEMRVQPAPPAGQLTLAITRQVQPTEIAYLVLGTGCGSYPWWDRIDIKRLAGVRYDAVQEPFQNTSLLDVVMVRADSPDHPEGSGEKVTRALPLQHVVDAVAKAWPHLTDEARRDMTEDLGLADAEAADLVLQMAMWGVIVYG